MPREFHQTPHERLELLHHQTVGIETAVAQFVVERRIARYAREHRCQLVECVVRKPKRTADVARGALAAIADHGCRERGAVTSVFVEDILDYFFTPLMLEIDVDVRRLIALA